MAVELSNVIYDVPTLTGKLQKLSFYANNDIYQLTDNTKNADDEVPIVLKYVEYFQELNNVQSVLHLLPSKLIII